MNRSGTTDRSPSVVRRTRRAAALLEILFALTLFVLAAGVVMGALQGSARAVQKVRLRARAADLAVTLLSEIQMGLVEPNDDGPYPYEDDPALADWTWEIVTAPVESDPELPQLKEVRILIANPAAGFRYRLVQLFPDDEDEGEGEEAFGGDGAPGGAP